MSRAQVSKEGSKGQKDVSVSGSFLQVGQGATENGERNVPSRFGSQRIQRLKAELDKRLHLGSRSFLLSPPPPMPDGRSRRHLSCANAECDRFQTSPLHLQRIKMQNGQEIKVSKEAATKPSVVEPRGSIIRKAGVTRDIGTENKMGKRSMRIPSIPIKDIQHNKTTAAVICVRSEILHQQARQGTPNSVIIIIKQAGDNVCISGSLIQASSSPSSSSSSPSTLLVLSQHKHTLNNSILKAKASVVVSLEKGRTNKKNSGADEPVSSSLLPFQERLRLLLRFLND